MMEIVKDASDVETIPPFVIEMMMEEKDSKDGKEEFTREYLKTQFLHSIGRSLYYARQQAGLTQAEIAERMNTTQSAVARFEADKNGSISFRRYVDFAIACNVMPRSLVLHSILESIPSLRDEIIDSFVVKTYQVPSNLQQVPSIGRGDIIRTILSAQNQAAASLIGRTPLPIQEFKTAIEAIQNDANQFHLQPLSKNALTTNASPPTTTAGQSTIDNQSTIGNKAGFVYA